VQAHRAAINCVAIAPDGELVATGSAEGSARLWFAQSGAEAGWLRGHDGCGGCVCCERTAPPPMWPGSQPDAGAALDDAPRALSPLCERVGHWAAVSAAAFEERPRGALATDRPGAADSAARRRRLATGGRDGVVVLWDARAAAPEQLLDCEGGEVLAVAFAHGLLATGGDGSRVLLWDAARPGAARVLRALMAGAVKARPAPIEIRQSARIKQGAAPYRTRRCKTCPISTEGGTRRVQLVREGGGGGGRVCAGGPSRRAAPCIKRLAAHSTRAAGAGVRAGRGAARGGRAADSRVGPREGRACAHAARKPPRGARRRLEDGLGLRV
jgi:hypothetical protein